jgi:hypothetical protein
VSPLDRILTVRQPWATLVIRYGKDVENRTWMTDYRGRLWIHAGLRDDDVEHYLAVSDTVAQHPSLRAQIEADKGHVIGHVDLIDCVNDSTSAWAERGAYHWILANPIALAKPVRRRGQQGLSNYTHEEET